MKDNVTDREILEVILQEVKKMKNSDKSVEIIEEALQNNKSVYKKFTGTLLKSVYGMTGLPRDMFEKKILVKENVKKIHKLYDDDAELMQDTLEYFYTTVAKSLQKEDQERTVSVFAQTGASADVRDTAISGEQSLELTDAEIYASQALGLSSEDVGTTNLGKDKKREEAKISYKKNYNRRFKLISDRIVQYNKGSLQYLIGDAFVKSYKTRMNEVVNRASRLITFSGAVMFYLPDDEMTTYIAKQKRKLIKIIYETIDQMSTQYTSMFLKYKHLATGRLATSLNIRPKVSYSSRYRSMSIFLSASMKDKKTYAHRFEHGGKVRKPRKAKIKKNKYGRRRAKRKFELKKGTFAHNIYQWIKAKEDLNIWDESRFRPIKNDKDRVQIAFAIRNALIKKGIRASYDTMGRVQKKKPLDRGMIEFILHQIIDQAKEHMKQGEGLSKEINKHVRSVKDLHKQIKNLDDLYDKVLINFGQLVDYEIIEKKTKKDIKKFKSSIYSTHENRSEFVNSVRNTTKYIQSQLDSNREIKKLDTAMKNLTRISSRQKPTTFARFFEAWHKQMQATRKALRM